VSAQVALVSSPLLGPFVWSRVARKMKDAGIPAIAATPKDSSEDRPWWERHARSVASAIGQTAPTAPVLLVGHSGAGPLLPAIAGFAKRPVAGYLFVDAGIPRHSERRIEAMRREDPGFADELLSNLQDGGSFPTWTMEDLEDVLPAEDDRRRLLREVRPRGLDFFSEPTPTSASWPDAPCGYVRLSAAYDVPAIEAARAGWPVRRLDGGHFQMLVDPTTLTQTLLDVIAEMGMGWA
jgi:hypothetical protein